MKILRHLKDKHEWLPILFVFALGMLLVWGTAAIAEGTIYSGGTVEKDVKS